MMSKQKKLTKKQQEKAKKARERMFEWQPEKLKGERAKYEKTIVIKKMFEPEEFDRDPGLILDYTNNIRYFSTLIVRRPEVSKDLSQDAVY